MNNFNELEQRALDALTALIPELIKKNGMLDMKKIIPNFYFNVLIAAYQTGIKNPVQWTTDSLNLGRNYFYQAKKRHL